jgi:hypothetical protein
VSNQTFPSGTWIGFVLSLSLTQNFPDSDVMCPGNSTPYCIPGLNIDLKGREHTVEVGGAKVRPSHCTLPMFHPVMDAANIPAGIGYVSSDGHHFNCSNPVLIKQAFHV